MVLKLPWKSVEKIRKIIKLPLTNAKRLHGNIDKLDILTINKTQCVELIIPLQSLFCIIANPTFVNEKAQWFINQGQLLFCQHNNIIIKDHRERRFLLKPGADSGTLVHTFLNIIYPSGKQVLTKSDGHKQKLNCIHTNGKSL